MTEIAQTERRSVDRMHVRIEHLDKLLSLAGEVIITSANLQDLERRAQDSAAKRIPLRGESLDLIKTSNEASRRISQDLHDLVMAIRLVRIGDTFRLFRRPVRDLCRSLGRDVELLFEGEETLVDKALAERLVDPLLHLLRNAVDHGIESPLERTRAGKPARGRVTVTARDHEHTTEITVRDDGRGIDEDAVRRAAAEAGAAAGSGADMVLDILCRPGFSMADRVTSTSGRGVGLDLVREVVGEFDGDLRLEGEPGRGALFRMVIPKLRAVNIIDALTLRAGRRLYALPIERVVASLGIPPDEIRTAFGRDRFFTYQGDVVAVRDLEELLGAEPVGVEKGEYSLVVVQGKRRRLALVISEFMGPQKLVHMPLDSYIRRASGVAGTAIFTGGRLGLTLDIDELIESAFGSTSSAVSRAGRARDAEGAVEEEAGERAEEQIGGASGSRAATGGSSVHLQEADAEELARELRQNMGALQDALLNMESEPDKEDHLNDAFRRLHAVKGNFTMLESDPAAETAHHLETVLDYLRAGRLESTQERMDLLLDGAGYLSRALEALPGPAPERPVELARRLREEASAEGAPRRIASAGDLIGRAFELSPTLELQTLCGLKRGERILESYFVFRPGRQADFLVAYLLLRRLGLQGNVLATIPSVDEIERGDCGSAVKVLWATQMEEPEVVSWLERLADRYNLTEHGSVAATVFRNAVE
ncbi:MAG: chemotaxis protein CheW [Candidatus Eisenbacteria bacterium]|nr:chemotaxis protein CheW [Candidatus Eisenbacteria bacterium]